jgi:hypothetical protein
MPVGSDVEAIGVIDPPRLVAQRLGRVGEVTIGLTPAPPSSVEPRGIEPVGASPGAMPAVVPLKVEGRIIVPEAVPPAPQDEDVDVPVVPVPMPALSKVEEELDVPEVPALDIPVPAELMTEVPELAHGVALAIGSNAIGLRPPGVSSVAPKGIPTGPADEAAPGTPSGEVSPIAGVVGVSGAICAKLAPALSSNSSDATARLFNATSHYRPGEGITKASACACPRLRQFQISCAFGKRTARAADGTPWR